MSKAKIMSVKVGGKKSTVKVGGKKSTVKTVSATEIKEKKSKPEFNMSKALDDNANEIKLNEGRLTAIPANVPEGCKGLKRNSFSTKTLYAEYQLYLMHEQQEKFGKRIEAKELEITELKTGGDPKMKKVRRVKKLQAQVDALLEALKEDGTDTSELE